MTRDKLTQGVLDYLEYVKGMSESQIAWQFHVSRMGLYKIRKRNGWPQRCRSDRGTKRWER